MTDTVRSLYLFKLDAEMVCRFTPGRFKRVDLSELVVCRV